MMGEERVKGRMIVLSVIVGVLFLLCPIVYRFPASDIDYRGEIRPGPYTIPLPQPYNRVDEGNDTIPPDADAGPDMTVDQNVMFLFDGSSSTDNVGIVNYSWTFDDKVDINLFGIAPSYIFIYAGHFYITLKVTDGGGNSNIDTKIIRVNDTEKPNASADIDQQADEGRIVLLQGNKSKDNIGITNYTWTIDDNGIKTLYGKTSSYRFKNIITNKEFEVILKVTDAAGYWDMASTKINIYPDTDEPVIDDIFPENNQKDVNVNVNPQIMFDDDIDPITVDGNVSIGISGNDIEVEFS